MKTTKTRWTAGHITATALMLLGTVTFASCDSLNSMLDKFNGSMDKVNTAAGKVQQTADTANQVSSSVRSTVGH